MMCGGMTRKNGYKLKQEDIQTRYMEKHFNQEDSQTVDEVSQRSCAVSIPGGFQDFTIKP